MFAFASAITIVFVICALGGCDADSVGQSNEEIDLDLSNPDVIAALFSASMNKESWDRGSGIYISHIDAPLIDSINGTQAPDRLPRRLAPRDEPRGAPCADLPR